VSDKRGWGKTVLGWFVVQEDGAGDASGDVAPGDAAAPPPPVALSGPLPPIVNGTVDFGKVYEAAGLAADERDRVTKARELFRTLPAETPAPVKKQIVEASLKAFGVPTEKIIEAAVAEIQALEAFIRTGQGDAQGVLAEGNKRMAELEAEIARVKEAMQQATAEQQARVAAANAEKLNVQQVLEFFGQEAVAKVVQESDRLRSPGENR
jgi:hypothetical protein